ncbi:MAG TPA: GerMN domain-containing protein [Thermoanaerobaculia bacterium]|nr:GerMN domain-containing protein [Thermoanaerobaculia bacterium]
MKTLAAALAILLALCLAACDQREPQAPPSGPTPEIANRVAPRSVILYFEGPTGLLFPETRELPLPDNEAAALHPLLAALVNGSANASVPRLFPEDTVIRGAFLLPEGTAVVDLGGATLEEGWNTGSRAEMLAAYAVVQTLVSNSRNVRRVQILVGGQIAPTLAGHLDLTRPLRPTSHLIQRPPG